MRTHHHDGLCVTRVTPTRTPAQQARMGGKTSQGYAVCLALTAQHSHHTRLQAKVGKASASRIVWQQRRAGDAVAHLGARNNKTHWGAPPKRIRREKRTVSRAPRIDGSEVAWFSRSDFICSASDDQTVRVWDVMERNCVKVSSPPGRATRVCARQMRMARLAPCELRRAGPERRRGHASGIRWTLDAVLAGAARTHVIRVTNPKP